VAESHALGTVSWPPERPPASLPSLEEESMSASWRLHGEEDPLAPRRYETGKFRFDAPAGEFAVTYVNLDPYACYAEVFGNRMEIPPSAAMRRCSRIGARRRLRLIGLDRATVQKAFGLDLNICSTLDYSRTQAWSRAWHAWYPDADGIRYLGRHAVEQRNVCLFLDRCAEDLEAGFEGFLKDRRREGLIAAHRYHLAPRLFFPSA
jgi:RES domain